MISLKHRILIVDDAATVRLYHRRILEDAGYSVDEALNGIEALEKVMQTDFDLLLVDINMPKQDGYEFIQQLRGQAIAQAPAIMITTEAETADRAEALRAGANFYFVKPIKPAQLTNMCRMLLGLNRGTS